MRLFYVDGNMTASSLASKYAAALAAGGADVELLLSSALSREVEGLFDQAVCTRHFGLKGRLQRVKRPIARVRLFSYLLSKRADCYVASDPSVLALCGFVARRRKARVVYVPFEYYPYLSWGPQRFRDRMALLERRLVPSMSAVVLCGDKIAEDYGRAYGSSGRLHVVYNGWPSADPATRPLLREKLGVTEREQIILYQGGIMVRRGLLKVVEAMPLLPPEAIFVILGYGPDGELVQQKAAELGVANRVRILPAVPQKDLMAYTRGADVGIIPILNVCRSYYLCNPGKLFEYIAAGLPLAVSNLAQLEWYVKTRGLGEVFDPGDPRDIARALRHLLEDREFRDRCAANSRATQQNEAAWEIQAEKFRRVVLGAEYRPSPCGP